MLEELLKELGKRGFEVLWRYEVMTNSIVMRMEKKADKQWYKLERRFEFSDFYPGGSEMFEFNMTLLVRQMAQDLEQMFQSQGL